MINWKVWKEVAMVCPKVLSQHLTRGSE